VQENISVAFLIPEMLLAMTLFLSKLNSFWILLENDSLNVYDKD
jgi:hypothetical protein